MLDQTFSQNKQMLDNSENPKSMNKKHLMLLSMLVCIYYMHDTLGTDLVRFCTECLENSKTFRVDLVQFGDI